jgi:hypothetical protein
MIAWSMRIACCVHKARHTSSEYVMHIAIHLQQYLHVRVSLLGYTDIVRLVIHLRNRNFPDTIILPYFHIFSAAMMRINDGCNASNIYYAYSLDTTLCYVTRGDRFRS